MCHSKQTNKQTNKQANQQLVLLPTAPCILRCRCCCSGVLVTKWWLKRVTSWSWLLRQVTPKPVFAEWTWIDPFWDFSRMRSEGSRFIWGSGGEAVFAESCVYVGNRSQPFATVCVSAISSPQWRVHQEWSRKRVELSHGRRSYIGVCSGGVCVSDLCRRRYIGICSGGVCVSDLCRRSYFGVWRGVVSVIDLCRRSYIDICRGGVCVRDLCRRSYMVFLNYFIFFSQLQFRKCSILSTKDRACASKQNLEWLFAGHSKLN